MQLLLGQSLDLKRAFFKRTRWGLCGLWALSIFSVFWMTLSSEVVWADGDENSVEQALLRYRFSAGELTRLCDRLPESTQTRLNQLLLDEKQRNEKQKNEKQKGEDPLLGFEQIMADFSEKYASLTFLKEVSTDESIRKESAECEDKLKKFLIDVYSRKDLFQLLKNGTTPSTAQMQRLKVETLKEFERNGLALSEEVQEKVKKLNQRLAQLETQFATNLNEDQSHLELSREELAGLSTGFISRLKQAAHGKWIVPLNEPNYAQLMDDARMSSTRRKTLEAWENRASQENTLLFQEALQVRKEIGTLMGYSTWADFQLKNRMAQTSQTALKFLGNLRELLGPRNQSDLAILLNFKKEEDPTATKLDPWDLRYLANQVKKRDYQVDNQLIREYFPKDTVVRGLFQVYSQLLGVKFTEINDANVWATGVQFFQIRDASTFEILGYFYTDFVPREGKYGHAAAFDLRRGRLLNSGTYLAPVSGIVANFSPAEPGKPVLLSYDEVETLFHEFGHIMHQTLTRAPYASLAGSQVAQDFVEAPSQMLENWVDSKEVLALISGHYKNENEKLPDDLIRKIAAAKNFNRGYTYSRQLVFALFDMLCHTDGSLDATALYKKLHQDLIGIPAAENSHFPATFGHLMSGYDSGYYGYLWSEVYAMDMFSVFEKGGIMNPEVGRRYRSVILEQGGMQDALDLLKNFLQREPSSEAFFKKLGRAS